MAKGAMCKNCIFLLNGWCEKKADSPAPDMVRDCRHFHRKTNGDRIRAMSDAELADLAFKLNVDEHINFCKMIPECEEMLDRDEFVDMKKCKMCFVAWLKEPVEEEEDG